MVTLKFLLLLVICAYECNANCVSITQAEHLVPCYACITDLMLVFVVQVVHSQFSVGLGFTNFSSARTLCIKILYSLFKWKITWNYIFLY